MINETSAIVRRLICESFGNFLSWTSEIWLDKWFRLLGNFLTIWYFFGETIANETFIFMIVCWKWVQKVKNFLQFWDMIGLSFLTSLFTAYFDDVTGMIHVKFYQKVGVPMQIYHLKKIDRPILFTCPNNPHKVKTSILAVFCI